MTKSRNRIGKGWGVALVAGLFGLAGCARPDPTIRPVSQLPLPLQAYLSVDAYFIAQGMVRGRLADGRLMHDQARDLVASTLYARDLTVQNMLHPTVEGQRRVQLAIEMMLDCVQLANSGSTAACLGPPPPVSGGDARPVADASRPATAESAPR
ncbi:hypothetical protein [Gluconacetobacter takamatsuzukensis]|uniref:Uncharacterized protein n=1 Tax=Gluconacetobacter takamatsuzukensis TaxID=1286190 RepID=A0A7W4KCQ1_9PROT|nr:hypothetical protein [Gluconacetobacter takamatsuzukensis]MBB2204420.1 hypothetical protein [Gluconacetobacter takamatsuzukensis]